MVEKKKINKCDLFVASLCGGPHIARRLKFISRRHKFWQLRRGGSTTLIQIIPDNWNAGWLSHIRAIFLICTRDRVVSIAGFAPVKMQHRLPIKCTKSIIRREMDRRIFSHICNIMVGYVLPLLGYLKLRRDNPFKIGPNSRSFLNESK